MKNPPVTREPILHVDCRPDSSYPLRILRAYRENANVLWELSGDFPEQLRAAYEGMNKASRKRAKILDMAIRILEKANLNGELRLLPEDFLESNDSHICTQCGWKGNIPAYSECPFGCSSIALKEIE